MTSTLLESRTAVRGIAGVTAFLLALFNPQVMQAQIEGRTTTRTSSTPLVVTRSGEVEGVRRADPARAAPPLTIEQIRQILAPLNLITSGAGAAKVSPSAMLAAGGRVELSFYEPTSVRAYGATLEPKGAVYLMVRPLVAGEQYLIDCTVGNSLLGPGSYRISGPGSSATFTGTFHLTVVYKATDSIGTWFKIESDQIAWSFHSCEVSRVYAQ